MDGFSLLVGRLRYRRAVECCLSSREWCGNEGILPSSRPSIARKLSLWFAEARFEEPNKRLERLPRDVPLGGQPRDIVDVEAHAPPTGQDFGGKHCHEIGITLLVDVGHGCGLSFALRGSDSRGTTARWWTSIAGGWRRLPSCFEIPGRSGVGSDSELRSRKRMASRCDSGEGIVARTYWQ